MSKSRLSGYHVELYTWALFCELRNTPTEPFKKIDYAWMAVNDALLYLYWDGYTVDCRNHWVAISAETNPDDWSLSRYLVEFWQDGTHKESEKLNALNNLLVSEGFCRSEDETFICKYLEDMAAVTEYVPNLFKKLSAFIRVHWLMIVFARGLLCFVQKVM